MNKEEIEAVLQEINTVLSMLDCESYVKASFYLGRVAQNLECFIEQDGNLKEKVLLEEFEEIRIRQEFVKTFKKAFMENFQQVLLDL